MHHISYQYSQLYSELEAVVLAPLLHHLHKVLDLGVVSILKQLDGLNQPLLAFLTGDHQLEDANRGTSLSLPELWIGVKSLEHVEGLHRVIELSHFVTVVGDQVKQTQTLIRCLHVDVDFPSQVLFFVHDVSATEPAQECVVVLQLFRLDLSEALFSIFVLTSGSTGNAEVPIEVIFVLEVGTDGLQVDQHIVELLQDEEAGGHALTTGNGVTLGRRGTDHLEEVLGNAHVVL